MNEGELIKVTSHEDFEAAHLLPNYEGPCGHLYRHTYKIELTFEWPQKENYYCMIMDFNELKKNIKEIVPDHKFMVWKDDEISMKIVLKF